MTIFPHELYENILFLADDVELWKTCSLVAKAFCSPAQALLFETINLELPFSSVSSPNDYLRTKLQYLGNKALFSHIYGHVRAVTIFLPDIQRSFLETELGAFLHQLTGLRSLCLSHDWALPWPDIGIDLRITLLEVIFPRLTILKIFGLIQIPFLSILSWSCALRHLSLGQFEEIKDQENIVEGMAMPELQSLTVDTYERGDFRDSSSLIRAIKLCRQSLRAIVLVKHMWGLDSANNSLSSVDNLLAHCAGNLTLLHIGNEIFGKAVMYGGRPNDHLPLSSLVHLEILQFEVSASRADLSEALFLDGHLFFTWLTRELSQMDSQSVLSQLVCDLNYGARAPHTPANEVNVWRDLDQFVSADKTFPHFGKFRLRLYGPGHEEDPVYLNMLRKALPLCASKSFVMVERWKDLHSIVTSVVREHCH
ncbi:hypothetical protein DL96DRAFT_1607173 [Flagelloscypha sp. PMI_526]|nr:hypothetical protein DL96DRAFT_1607173 [Flagelloscypha sp. PMI_526]